MTQFSVVLRTAMDGARLSQEELTAKMAGGSQSSLSRWLLGDGLPRKNMLEQICRQFEPRIRQALTQAYLVDLIPPSAADLVSVGSVQEGEAAQNHYKVGDVPKDSILWRDLMTLGRAGMKKPNLAKMLNYFASLERGEDPHPDYFETESIREDPRFIAAKKELARRSGKSSREKKPGKA